MEFTFCVFCFVTSTKKMQKKKIFQKLFDDGSPSISFAKYLFYACEKFDAFIIKGVIDQNICTIWVHFMNIHELNDDFSVDNIYFR